MNKVIDLIDEHHIQIGISVSSKKALFEYISKHVCQLHPSLADEDIVAALIQREKFGSTSIGHGVAIPHCRLVDCTHSILGLFILDTPLLYNDDADEVDIVALLLVPFNADDEHLELLSEFAQHFNNPRIRSALRSATTHRQALSLMTQGISVQFG